MPFKVTADDNISLWGGAALTAAPTSGTPALGTEVAPVVRDLLHKQTQILTTVPLGVAGQFTSPWFESNSTGDMTVVAVESHSNNVNSNSNGFQIQGTNDIITPGPVLILALTTVTGGVTTVIQAFAHTRYWRVFYLNGGTTEIGGTKEISVTSSNYVSNVVVATPSAAVAVNQLSVTLAPSNNLNPGAVDPVSVFKFVSQDNTFSGVPGVATFVFPGNAGTVQAVGLRTPNIFRGSQFSAAGSNVIWQPTTGKKFRLMKYKIEVAADATVAGGATPVNLAFSCTEAANGTIGGIGTTPLFNFNHRMVVPGSSASSFAGYDTGWIDLGNGILSLAANQKLTMGIQAPQSVSAVSPAWTITSNQWEAVTVGFKTQSNAGLFRLMDSAANDSVTGTVAGSTSLNSVAGDTIVVVIRTTNAAGGAPTVVVTDTYLNTYTTTALTTNASDGAHGSSLCIAYCTNIATGAAGAGVANVITVTTSVNVATAMGMIALEYSNMGSGGIDAALVGTTGNSTTAASGSYTPATTGDLIITAFATAGAIAPVSTVNSNFRSLAQRTNQPLSVADNFGNGSLATGQINVIACGTEE